MTCANRLRVVSPLVLTVVLALLLATSGLARAGNDKPAAPSTAPSTGIVAGTFDAELIRRIKEQLKAEIKAEIRAELESELRAKLQADLQAEREARAKADEEAKKKAPTGADGKPKDWVDKALSFVERLPPSAYPEPRVRGIRGGSLAATFHGLQWPYYPKTGIGISGYVWIDSGYQKIKRGNPTEQSIQYWLQQGRLVLRITPTYTHGRWFIQGQAELVGNKDQSSHQPDIVDTDDLWIKVGMWKFLDRNRLHSASAELIAAESKSLTRLEILPRTKSDISQLRCSALRTSYRASSSAGRQ